MIHYIKGEARMSPTPRRSFVPVPAAVLLFLAARVAAALAVRGPQHHRPCAVAPRSSHLASFAADEELRRFLRQVRERARRRDLRTFDIAQEPPGAAQSTAAAMSMDAESMTNTERK